MENTYIDVPAFTTLRDIEKKNYSLSATQYKLFCIKNDNVHPVAEFLDRKLTRSDLGVEVGSENYIEGAPFLFIKTKALQVESFLLDEGRDATERIPPQAYQDMNLKEGDILISKDSNVGEIVILDKDYPKAMLCGGIYRLPISKNKYYLLAFIKSDLFRQQIDFMVPRGSTIRHGKTKFLDCLIPLPNKNTEKVMMYVEVLTKAIVNKEIAIRKRYQTAMKAIQDELETNQKATQFKFVLPTIEDLLRSDRMDSSIYTEDFKAKEFLITNYRHGVSTIYELGFKPSRGQNLQVSNIGKSIQTPVFHEGYYTLILPKFLSKYGTVNSYEYLGNPNELKTLKKGEIIFGAEGNEKGRSLVIMEEQAHTITNIHGITLNQSMSNIQKGVFIKLFLDYYRSKGMIDAYAVGGNGGSLAIQYWDRISFPKFPDDKEKEIVELYHNGLSYDVAKCTLENFSFYDDSFNDKAGIYELDKSLKYLREKLRVAIDDIANDKTVEILF